MFDRAYGIGRSLVTYYGQPWRHRRRRAFYGQFLGPGSLGFDIGSHVGDRVGTWLALGARVVAVEPQPDFARLLRVLYVRRGVRVLERAVGREAGRRSLLVSSRTPTVSTLSRDFIDEVQRDRRFSSIRWDHAKEVEIITLDQLVREHGEPDFVKIDVEGFELEVLEGATAPLRALSFEYIPPLRARAMACVRRLSEVGDYRFRPSPVETTRWSAPEWLDVQGIEAHLAALSDEDGSGDVYAVRADVLSSWARRNGR